MKSRTTASTAAATSASPTRLLPLVPGSPTRRPPLFPAAISAAASPIFLLPLVPCAAASALFALQSHADAGIIYSGPQSLTLGPIGALGYARETLQITAGCGLTLAVQRFNESGKHFGSVLQFSLGQAPFVQNHSSIGVHRFAPGAAITAGANFNSGGNILVGFKNGNPYLGTWLKGQTGYAGFKMPNGDLGWIRLEWNSTDSDPSPNEVIAMDYAYDTTPGQTINAGQTSSVPEPSAAALLALAAAGAAFLRRKRAHPKF